jgi:putative SOS response-associated peptidase YedK
LGIISSGKRETIMCGRVRLSSDYSEIKIRLKFAPNSVAPNYELDWSKPPTAPMLVAIRSIDGERVPKMMKWGLIPHWARDNKLQYSTFNARAEEFTIKPAFRDAWSRDQRCLVVTDGFYEWKKLDGKGKLGVMATLKRVAIGAAMIVIASSVAVAQAPVGKTPSPHRHKHYKMHMRTTPHTHKHMKTQG